ncbi:uncharacterized protein K02A2.6-like [Uranotaenia lowii]|uniref:uncharacterized protein K02A2.6-like n=1 Tax=Uranotaenia lowii TaxID=190385 RepID=UPI0024791CE2|nr:uncharacterized protein K02A2.6-like [Uranotaenia lowii]
MFRKRYRCLQTVKSSHEDYISYSAAVNRRCEEFNVGRTTVDQFKCLVFVCGLQSPDEAEIRMRLINRLETEPDTMNLAILADECNRLVNLRKDTSMVEQQEVNSVHKAATHTDTRTRPTNLPKAPCWLCGGVHFVRDCEYANHRCAECQQFGHKEGYCVCIRPPRNTSYRHNRTGGDSRRGDGSSNWHRYHSRSLVCNQVLSKAARKYVTVLINEVKTELQIDTASDITVISEKRWEIIGKPATTTTSAKALTASGTKLQLSSQFQATLTLGEISKQGIVYVTKSNLNILGIDWIEQFGIWDVPINSICRQLQLSGTDQIKKLKSTYSDVFSDEPSVCAKVEVNLAVKEGAVPVFRPKRPVSFGSLNLVENELDRLERRGVITPVTYSDWAAPIVVVKKSDKSVRICGDYSTGLNAVLTPHKYPLPTPDEIFATLSGGIIFSILDLRDGYLLMNVSEESRKYLTINTHKGLYQYNRLSPGLRSAPGAFQQVIDTILAGIPGVKPYIDDVIITGYLLLPSKNIPQDKVPVADRIRRFESGDAVYVQQHVRESTKWSPGEVVKCLGNVLYTVQLDNGRIVTAHVNQMIRRYGEGPSNKPQLPLDILVDSFDMYPTKQIATPQLPVEGVNNEVFPLRRSGRTRNVPVRYRDYHLY